MSKLTTVIDDYCMYLRQQCKAAKIWHNSVADSDLGTMTVLPIIPVVSSRLTPLNNIVKEKQCYDKVYVNDYTGADPKNNVQDLRKGLTVATVLYTFSLGTNLENYIFVSRIPHGVSLEAATNENVRIINDIKKSTNLPLSSSQKVIYTQIWTFN